MIIMDVNVPARKNKVAFHTALKKSDLIVFPSNQFYYKNYSQLNFSQEMLLTLQNCGFSSENIAKELNIASNTFYRILNGQIKNPKPQIFYKLFRFYCANYWSKEILRSVE